MNTGKKSNKALQFTADAELIRFINEQAKKKTDNSLLQLLNIILKMPRKHQGVIWDSVFMMLWSSAPGSGVGMNKEKVIDAVASGAKLTKADAGRLIQGAVTASKELIDAIASSAKLTKADAG